MDPNKVRVTLDSRLRRVHMKFAKAAPKRLELIQVEILVSKKDNLMSKERLIHLMIRLVVEWMREIYTTYLGSHDRREWVYPSVA